MGQKILLTGGTGLIGGSTLPLLAKTATKIWVVVRTNETQSPQERLDHRYRRAGKTLEGPVVPVRGNTTRSTLGISETVLREIHEECDTIVHMAGYAYFDDGYMCRSVNVDGAWNVIEFAKHCKRLKRVFFVSSASVCCGPPGSDITEDSRFDGYANDYVRSKREAEALFRESGLDFAILRPSIVFGYILPDRKYAREIAWVMPIIATLGFVPLSGTERLDLISVDYAAGCIAQLVASDSLHYDCYNVSAGSTAYVTSGEIIQLLLDTGTARNGIRLVSDEEWKHEKTQASPGRRRIMSAVEMYLPFIRADLVYINKRLKADTNGVLPECNRFTEYAGYLLRQFSLKDALQESYKP